MEEKAKSRVLIYIIVVLVLSILALVILGIIGYKSLEKKIGSANNNEIKTVEKEEITLENINTGSIIETNKEEKGNTLVNEDNKITQEVKTEEINFTIASIKEVENGYTLSVHMLADEPRKITKQEYENVLNGGTIKFRGREWEKAKTTDETEKLYLVEKGAKEINSSDIPGELILHFYDIKGYGIIDNIAGKRTDGLRDYKSENIVELNTGKGFKAGWNGSDGSSWIKYDSNTSEIEIYSDGKKLKQNEENENTKQIMEYLEKGKRLNTPNSYGECCAYLLNGKIIGLGIYE